MLLQAVVSDETFTSDCVWSKEAVPPLRKRQEDIEILANHFVDVFSRETGRKIEGFSSAAIAAMLDYHWPGNIRELRNCIERAVVLSSSDIIDVNDLALAALASPGDTGRLESTGNNLLQSR